ISNYGALYTGLAEMLTDDTGVQPQIVYTLNSQDTVFALTKKGIETMCGHVLVRTEHPKLLIFETTSDNKIFSKVYKPENLDIFTYMNSKFVYVEKHIRTQISQLYRNVLQQQGQPGFVIGGSFSNLLSYKASIEKIAMSVWEKFWNKFLIFGNVSAGIIGIYICTRIIKLILDTIVHGYALHTVYGWSVFLIGVIWDSLTNLLIHLGKERRTNKNIVASAPAEPESKGIKYSEVRDDTRTGSSYPLLPPKEASTYTLELKG
ncbi:hypothetical protein ALC57_07653, partial [Trachymyrmex cornetzi]